MPQYYIDQQPILVSVDCIVFGFEEGKLKLLIGKRRFEPGFGRWSLYGGFVRPGEDLEAAADRALYELTGLTDMYMRQVGAFGNVERDEGGRVISVAYYALINVKDYKEEQMERYRLKWVDVNDLPELYSDHNAMVRKALQTLRRKISHEPIGFNLLPDLFTLTQLQRLYEAVYGEELDKRNFRKRVKDMDFIEKTDNIDKKSSRRGAYLYKFNSDAFEEGTKFKL